MILLDSHILYWLASGSADLTRATLRLIERTSPVFVSALSILELQSKMQKARLAKHDFLAIVTNSNLSHLPFTAEDAAAVTLYPTLQGHDPIDAALLAQARNNRLDFVTADRRLLALGLPWVIDATV